MTMYSILAAAVTLSAFALALAAGGALASLTAPRLARRVASAPSAVRAALYFRLRMLPLAAAAMFSVLLVLPTFLYYEPADTDEALTMTMLVVASFGLALAAAAMVRVVRAWQATRHLGRFWRASGRRVDGVASPFPVFAVHDDFPTVAVVGCVRPVLFVAERVLAECSEAEVEAMIAHECAHVAARDNAKRLLLRACPRLPFGDALERAWAAAAEEAADAAAAGHSPQRRVELAQALITLARLAPADRWLAPVSAFYPGGTIEDRIRRLLEPGGSAPNPSLGCVFGGLTLLGLAGVFVAAGPLIHSGMEALVRSLP
jgi:hypothetical protein